MTMSQKPSPLWNVPYRRNKFYTERDDALHVLHQDLKMLDAVALTQPQAITGLGGIGKTQMALEYAYRYGSTYTAVLWVRADSSVGLISSFMELAQLLELSERNEQDQKIVVEAVQRWLRLHRGWLLIFDNMDEPAIAMPFLPNTGPGHLLLTTRVQALSNLAWPMQVQPMKPEIGALLLLRRAEILALQATLEQADKEDGRVASEISRELDGLPLALDQAGAYINATSCLLEDYLHLYRTRHQYLLQERGSFDQDYYPASVATTWSLSFEKVKQAQPAAADLLNFCAFLAPDAIPEALILEGAPHLGNALASVTADPVELDLLYKEVLKYSLVQREGDAATLAIHRLVQAVLRDRMPVEMQHEWMHRAVLAVDTVIPNLLALERWNDNERYLPHAVACTTWIEQEKFHDKESAYVLNWVARCLNERAQYEEAEPLSKRGLAMYEQLMEQEYPTTALLLSNLASIYQNQGKYTEAESLLQRALTLYEQLGAPHTVVGLNNLAALYNVQGKYTEAEPLLQRAIAMHEQSMSPAYPHLAQSLNNLAALYKGQGRYAEAEPLLQRALAIVKQHLGSEDIGTARSLNNLGAIYQAQGKYTEAEPLLKHATEIYEQLLGTEHPDTATSLNNLGALYQAQEKYTEAEPLLQRALEIRKQQLGLKHPGTAESFNNLGALYHSRGKYQEAESLYMQALRLYIQFFGPEHIDTTIQCMCNLAVLYAAQGNYEEAEVFFRYVLIIYKQHWGSRHPLTKALQEYHGTVMIALGSQKLQRGWKRMLHWFSR